MQIDIAVAMYDALPEVFTVMHMRSSRTSRHIIIVSFAVLINSYSAESAEIDL